MPPRKHRNINLKGKKKARYLKISSKQKLQFKKNIFPYFPTISRQPKGTKKNPRNRITKTTCLKLNESANWFLVETLRRKQRGRKIARRGFEERKKEKKGENREIWRGSTINVKRKRSLWGVMVFQIRERHRERKRREKGRRGDGASTETHELGLDIFIFLIISSFRNGTWWSLNGSWAIGLGPT